MDHQGYKWWKKQHSDTEQVQLEVVDIWHFGMSALFEEGKSIEQLATEIAEAQLLQLEAEPLPSSTPSQMDERMMQMVEKAEEFFTSLGMPELPDTFKFRTLRFLSILRVSIPADARVERILSSK